MSRNKLFAAGAATAALSLVLTACSVPGTGDGDDGDAGSAGGSIILGWNQPFYSYNEESGTGNATANSTIKYLMNNNFWYSDQQGGIQPNEDFGTYEQVSEEPLVVDYQVNEETTWSDGVPVDAADILLAWAANSGNRNTEVPEGEEAPEGAVAFTGSSIGLARVTEAPEVSEDGKGATFTYSEPFADWQFDVEVNVPAHVVAQNALGIEDPMEAKQALITAIQDNDAEALAPIADFWNTGFDYTSMPDDPALALSNGAYLLTAFEEDEFLTLTRNEDFEGERQASFDSITVRWEGDPLAQVQALRNGEIDMMAPQATADLVDNAEQVPNAEIISSIDGTYEHIDLVFDNGGPFDPANYGGDAETALQVRQAFLSAIPREQIVERLITPISEEAGVRNSFTVVPGSEGYDDVVAGNGTDIYAEVDPARSQQLLEQAGVTTPVDVRLLFDSTNERRVSQFQLLQPALAEAGFNLIDGSDPNWGELLSDNSGYDASMFGWQSTSAAIAESAENFRTGGQNNFGGYSNAQVDELYDDLVVTTDRPGQIEILTQIEEQLVNDAFGLTIYQFPGVTIYNADRVANVEPGVLNPTMYYGFWDWTAP